MREIYIIGKNDVITGRQATDHNAIFLKINLLDGSPSALTSDFHVSLKLNEAWKNTFTMMNKIRMKNQVNIEKIKTRTTKQRSHNRVENTDEIRIQKYGVFTSNNQLG